MNTTAKVSLSILLFLLTGILAAGFSGYPYWNTTPFVSPVSYKNGELPIRSDGYGSGEFGSRRSGGRKHRGIDLVGEIGAPVYAVRSGRVVKADYHPGYGNFIIIDHGREQESLYAHLKGKEVRRGERVRQGEKIGIIGKTGNARRRAILPHLHFEWIDHGNPQDPTELIRQAKVKTENEKKKKYSGVF